MKIAVFGGSFNPLHIGHAMLADTIITELGYDKVLFVPTCIPPHKTINSKITPQIRLEMLKNFCNSLGDSRFEVDSCEIDRGGISYTCDTLKFIFDKYKDVLEGKLAFVMGDEVAAEFDKWHNCNQVSELADLIITHRYPDVNAMEKSLFDNTPTGDYKGDFAVKFDCANFKYPFVYLEKPMLPVSSTEVRTRIAEKRSFRYLLPDAIFKYILEHNLYKE